jgi:hypothetical protein
MEPTKAEIFGVRFHSWWPVAWLSFGVIGAAVYLLMRYNQVNPNIINVWIAFGVCHWPVGVAWHGLLKKHMTFDSRIWNQSNILHAGMLAGTIALMGYGRMWWVGLTLVYLCGSILLAEWLEEKKRANL